jgi:hypothetical protein
VLVVKKGAAIAELAPASGAATTTPPDTPPPTTTSSTPPPSMAAAGSPPPAYSPANTPTKRAPSEEEVTHAPKRRKFKLSVHPADTSSWAGPPKRRFSELSEASPGGAMIKRTKKDHKEGGERPALAERKRGAGNEFVQWREDVRMKKGRPGYFQDGDPPMEYEDVSSDDEEEDHPGDDPVVLSSDEGEEEEL